MLPLQRASDSFVTAALGFANCTVPLSFLTVVLNSRMDVNVREVAAALVDRIRERSDSSTDLS
jgi:hypothetical protein